MPDTSSSAASSSEAEQPPTTPSRGGKGKGKATALPPGIVPVPASACPAAFRKHCKRGLNQIGLGKEVDQTWKGNSKKCGYCISQNADCNWVPLTCEAEYAKFAEAERVWETSPSGSEAEAHALEARRVAALVLVATMQVSRSQMKQEGLFDILTALTDYTQSIYLVLQDMQEKQAQRDELFLKQQEKLTEALEGVVKACEKSPNKVLKRKAQELEAGPAGSPTKSRNQRRAEAKKKKRESVGLDNVNMVGGSE